ncbi:MAG: glycosyltransferase [Lyngbya sp.]|nr:glycosyltransferase [Lyngbya sp.]
MRIHLEGWRFIPHSVAIANHFKLEEMMRRPELQLSFQDLPYSNSNWQAVQNLFDSSPQLNEAVSPSADVTLRMAEPLNLNPSQASQTVVFAMAEWGVGLDKIFLKKPLGSPIILNSNFRIITPSHWSKLGLLRSGIEADKITVVPWGVDPNLYQPLTPSERKTLRKKLAWDDYFIFLNVSPLEDRNGIRPLLKAFVSLVERYPHVRLVLKGCEALYPSKESVLTASKSILSDAEVAKIKPNIAYIGETFSFQQMAQLYQAADAYVCPYVASGFHLSALEAMACGLPIISTNGGATDDFVHPDFSLKIDSKYRSRIINQRLHFFLHPDWEHLVELMEKVIEQPEIRQEASQSLPKFVRENYTWKHTVDKLLSVFKTEKSLPIHLSDNFSPISTKKLSLLVEGWRFIPHSYGLINSYLTLELHQRENIQLFHQDMAYVSDSWKAVEGLLSPEAEQQLKRIPIAIENHTTDVTLRVHCPFNLANSRSQKTLMFACTEWGGVPQSILRGMKVSSFREAHLNSDTIIITASHWSKQGFLNSGADPERVVVIPLGFEPNIYYPLKPDKRQALRQRLGWNNAFVFLNIGVMWNERQGIDRLLKAFAILTEKYSNIRLVLKGRDAIFPSKESIQKASKDILTETEIERIKSRMYYIGESLSALEMAELFQAADAYISPYSAEGFNLPVLEAMACGLPVICTDGGSTDDFVHPEFVWKIESKLKMMTEKNGDIKFYLEPNTQHLIELMEAMIENSSFRNQAYQNLPPFVANNFTWKHVVDQLLTVIF